MKPGICVILGIAAIAAGAIFWGALREKNEEPQKNSPVTVPVEKHEKSSFPDQEKDTLLIPESSPPVQCDNSTVEFIVTQANSGPFKKRILALNDLPDDLSQRDCQVLLDYLHAGENTSREYGIKNDIMNKLRDQKELHPELLNTLLRLAEDPRENIVVRSYAVQHLRPLFEVTKDARIKQIYEQLLQEKSEVSGCALLALRYLSGVYPAEFSGEAIAAQSMALAATPEAQLGARVSAVQTAASLGYGDLSLLRSLAWEEDTSLALRIAAIAALGQLADHDSKAWLEETSSRKGPLRQAAQTALRRLESK